MENGFKKVTGISLRYWVTAILLNTLLAIYVLINEFSVLFSELPFKILICSAIFSLPIALVVGLLFYLLFKFELGAGSIFLVILMATILLSIGSFYLFSNYMELSASLNIPLGMCALTAGSLAWAFQFNAVRKICFQRDHPGHFRRKEKEVAQ